MNVTSYVEWQIGDDEDGERTIQVEGGAVPSKGDHVSINGVKFVVARIDWAIFDRPEKPSAEPSAPPILHARTDVYACVVLAPAPPPPG